MLESYGVTDMDKYEIKEIVDSWRASRPLVKRFWYAVEKAAIRAIKTKAPQRIGRVKFWVSMYDNGEAKFLHCGLPDGTILNYPSPKVEVIQKRKDWFADAITFWGTSSDKSKPLAGNKEWGKITTYGGKLTENIVQSLARRVLADAMLRVEAFGMPIVMHVHDEIVCELPNQRPEFKTLEFFKILMKVIPPWAKGLPLDVDAWEGKRYKK